jgi:hypothetical protein
VFLPLNLNAIPIVCVRCGKDWTADLENIADAPGASLDALRECGQLIVAEGARPSVLIIKGLVAQASVESRALMTRRSIVGLVVTILVALSVMLNGLANSGWWP